jgi:hypothetical protein
MYCCNFSVINFDLLLRSSESCIAEGGGSHLSTAAAKLLHPYLLAQHQQPKQQQAAGF